MDIKMNTDGGKMNVALTGRLDTTTSPQFETQVLAKLEGVKELILDITELLYISSAGLRVLLACQKKMNVSGGKMVVINPNEMIMDVFEMTGFNDILTIENNQ